MSKQYPYLLSLLSSESRCRSSSNSDNAGTVGGNSSTDRDNVVDSQNQNEATQVMPGAVAAVSCSSRSTSKPTGEKKKKTPCSTLCCHQLQEQSF